MGNATTATAEPSRGRFAPSPTGRLHIGSLFTATASWLRAHACGGQWLVRIEDIDPPREVPGAADDILRQLEAAGLHWDGEVVRQSTRLARYRDIAHSLVETRAAFPCSCSRREIAADPASGPRGTRYPGTCRTAPRSRRGPHALRLRVSHGTQAFMDQLQGRQACDLATETGDFVIWRKDDLPAYHLAVVIDDAEQGVTEIVRGTDLLEATHPHRELQRRLQLPTPDYLHVPVLVDSHGAKLSKQTGATELRLQDLDAAMARCLGWLGWTTPRDLDGAPAGVLLAAAAGDSRFTALAGVRTLAHSMP
ncbi:MAG: tRNA glutamyl-Q(34) synthetase GluQRS [Gammaproteobacteria bacterium]|nr:MAG: tRNA glutamyl-Q(34) synthetase GluQRS [Gammaproteobacteria bacterium]